MRNYPASGFRREGCNRTNAVANFGVWTSVVEHVEEKAKEIASAAIGYKPACWKFDSCETENYRESQNRFHQSFTKVLIAEVRKRCSPHSDSYLAFAEVSV